VRTVILAGSIVAKKYEGNRFQIHQWMKDATLEEIDNPAKYGKLGFAIATPTGKMKVSVGQWVVNLGHAVFMPLTPEQAVAFGLEMAE
jgi:hypothetical protein